MNRKSNNEIIEILNTKYYTIVHGVNFACHVERYIFCKNLARKIHDCHFKLDFTKNFKYMSRMNVLAKFQKNDDSY